MIWRVFDTSGFPARWNCGSAWAEDPALGWIHIIADVVTWIAYLLIPCVLVYYIARKKDVTFPRVFWLFCAFIFACGTVHLLEAVIFWIPVYRLSGIFKLITAVTSATTLVALVRIAPTAIALPGLAEINARLSEEIVARRATEQGLIVANTELRAALKKAEAAQVDLRDSQAKLRGVFDNSRAFVGLLSPDGVVLDANETSVSAAGIHPDDALGKLYWETPWWSHSEELRNRLKQAIACAASGESDFFEASHPSDDGTTIDVAFSLSPIFSDQGDVIYLIPEGHDITAEKANRKAAEASEERMRLTFDSSPIALLVADGNSKITMVNPQMTKTFGYESEELLGESIEMLIPQTLHERHRLHREGYQANPKARSMGSGKDLFGVTKDGTEIPLEIGLTPMGKFSTSTMATITDISNRKRNERFIVEKNEQLNRLNAELVEFSYSTSHDLKAPLASITGLLDFCESDLEDGDVAEVRANIQKAKRLAKRLASRVESILYLAKSDMDTSEPESISVKQRVDDAWESLPHEGVELETDFRHRAPIFSVPLRFDMVVENLLSNAVKYQDPEKERKLVKVATWTEGNDFFLAVKDNGIGIPSEYLEKIFRLFHRLNTSDKSGTGLGLTLAKKNVARMNGSIEAKSNELETVFTIKLPQPEREYQISEDTK